MGDIKDYFLVGDLHSAALISSKGSVDWLCFPHFDSWTLFAKLLEENAGCFALNAPTAETKARYIPDTAIVETTVKQNSHAYKIKDFMVPQEEEICTNHILVKKIDGVKGTGEVKLTFNPKPHYARQSAEIAHHENKLILNLGDDTIQLHLPEDCTVKKTKKGYALKTSIKPKEEKQFILEYIRKNSSSIVNPNHAFEKATRKFWTDWLGRKKFPEYEKHLLTRSAITLKLTQFFPTGALIAAPTTSLPADPKGVRNWDYRYVWIRDATFTLYALSIVNCKSEAQRFFSFIEKITEKCTKENFEINTLYTIWGDRAPKEIQLSHLKGYKGAQPVRVGNDATEQFQSDVYSTLIDTYYFIFKKRKIPKEQKHTIISLLKEVEKRWMDKDHGIWEFRGEPKHYTYSKVMSWLGVDRALRMAKQLGLAKKEIAHYKSLRKEIEDWIWENCYDQKRKVLTLHPETTEVDATNFFFVSLQFLRREDPRTKPILDNTWKALHFNNSLLARYRYKDNIRGKDHAFILCTFWAIAAYAILKDTKKAKKMFNAFKKRIASSGLLAEQIHEQTGEYLGNFPQAFSHMGLIMAAHYIDKYS